MATKKMSESVFDIAVKFEENLESIKDEATIESIKRKIDKLLDLAIKIEEKEINMDAVMEQNKTEIEEIVEDVKFTANEMLDEISPEEQSNLKGDLASKVITAENTIENNMQESALKGDLADKIERTPNKSPEENGFHPAGDLDLEQDDDFVIIDDIDGNESTYEQEEENGFHPAGDLDLEQDTDNNTSPFEGPEYEQEIFKDWGPDEKNELKADMAENLALAQGILVEKGNERKNEIEKQAKEITDETKETVNNMYGSALENINDKIEDSKDKLEKEKENKKNTEREAIEQFKGLTDQEVLAAFENEANEIKREITVHQVRKKKLLEKCEFEMENSQALAQYEKRGFFSRFINNFISLSKRPELTDEERDTMIKNGAVPEKLGFFARIKMAFTNAREEKRNFQERTGNKELAIMQEYKAKIEEHNNAIVELEDILAQNIAQRESMQAEHKEKLNEVERVGKEKAEQYKSMVDEEIELCSNPEKVVEQSKVSKLKSRFKRIKEWGKEKINSIVNLHDKEEEEEMEVDVENIELPKDSRSQRNSGMDR